MTLLALGLVLFSAVLHATRDLLAKRSRNKQAFSWWYHVVGLAIMLPTLLWTIRSGLPRDGWFYAAASGLVHALYFYSLAEAYREGDLSLVYPISRSSPLFVLLYAGLVLREPLSRPGVIGVLLVAFGAYALQMRRLSLGQLLAPIRDLARDRSIRLAWATALLVATYSLIDDRAVAVVSPALYLVVYGAIGLAAYTPIVLHRTRGTLKAEWRTNWRPIVAAGTISPLGYLFALMALRIAPVSYVSSTRQISIVLGVLLGTLLLKERFGRIRLVAATIMLVGIWLIAYLG